MIAREDLSNKQIARRLHVSLYTVKNHVHNIIEKLDVSDRHEAAQVAQRAETVATKPVFRQAFKRRRCLILADGFYEWQTIGKAKQPYLIHRPDDRPFVFAGPWEWWKGNDLVIESCTILTTEANATMQPLHDRMPVIVDERDQDQWLDSEADAAALLRPAPEELLETYPVSTQVNRPVNEGAKLVERIRVA